MWTVDPTPFRGFTYRKLEYRNTLQQECRNRDMRNRDVIEAVDSRSDLDRRIIGQVASDWNFADLESTKHGVETREM
jgi:hypothetical protein